MVFSTTTTELFGNRNRPHQHHRHPSYPFELARNANKSGCLIDDQAMDVLHVMLRQETDYLPSRLQHTETIYSRDHRNERAPAPIPNHRTGAASINPNDRRKLVRWGIQVMDFCKLDRCLVEVAMNYTDRYISCHSTRHVQWTCASYQLVAMTSVYIAVKLYSCEAMDPQLVSGKLSRNTYTVAEIEAQERRILQGLEWRLHLPTAAAFLANYMDVLFRCGLFPHSLVSMSQQLSVYDFALEQILFRVEHNHHHYQGTEASLMRPSTMALEALREGLLRECCCCSGGGSRTSIDPAQVDWALSLLPQYRRPRRLVPCSAPSSPKQQAPHMLRITASSTCPALTYSLSEEEEEQLPDVNDDDSYFDTTTKIAATASSSSPRCVVQQQCLSLISPYLFLQQQQHQHPSAPSFSSSTSFSSLPFTTLTANAAAEDSGMLLQ